MSGSGEGSLDGCVVGAGKADQEAQEEDRQEEVRGARQALLPEMVGAFLGGAETADILERRAHAHVATPPPCST